MLLAVSYISFRWTSASTPYVTSTPSSSGCFVRLMLPSSHSSTLIKSPSTSYQGVYTYNTYY